MGIKFGECGYEMERLGEQLLSVYFRASNGHRVHVFDMTNRDVVQLARLLLAAAPGQED